MTYLCIVFIEPFNWNFQQYNLVLLGILLGATQHFKLSIDISDFVHNNSIICNQY